MRSRFLMIFSLVFLGVGLIGILVIKASNQPEPIVINKEVEVSTPEVSFLVWVAKEEIPKGAVLTRQSLKLLKMSEAEAHGFGIKQDIEIDFIEGMVSKRDLQKGQPVFHNNIAYPGHADYVNLVIEPGYIPSMITVPSSSVFGGGISNGSIVDLLVLSSSTQNFSQQPEVLDLESVSISPLFIGVKVLQVNLPEEKPSTTSEKMIVPSVSGASDQVSLTLQLTRKQIAKLTVAKAIAKIEVHLSTGDVLASELSADAGDVLSDYKSVREYRARSQVVK